jgi:hypothetical protein
MKKPTSSTATPSSSDWASDGVIVYLVGLSAGAKEGFVPSFGEKKLTKGEWDYRAVREGDTVKVVKEVNFWNRESAKTNVSQQQDKVNQLRVRMESAQLQMDGANKALEQTKAKLEYCRDEERAAEEAIAETWVLTALEHEETYKASKAKYDDACKVLAELKAVTFPEPTEFVIDLNTVKLA